MHGSSDDREGKEEKKGCFLHERCAFGFSMTPTQLSIAVALLDAILRVSPRGSERHRSR